MLEIWTYKNIESLYQQSLLSLLFQAQQIHQQHFANNEIQLSSLLSIKTGTCPEDCAYCPQSGHYNTELEKEALLDLSAVMDAAQTAKANGATRFCMGAAWRSPPKKQFPQVLEMIKSVKALGLETCVTLGMLDQQQAEQLKQSGLDYYNHNLDSSREYYEKIITTRTYDDRLNTLSAVRNAGINVCCGGIIGMGESQQDRINFLLELVSLPEAPQSIPINRLIPAKGTPLEDTKKIDNIEFIRTVATARILMPNSVIRLSAGRSNMSEEMQLLCFLAGANSIFYGDKLLTMANYQQNADQILLEKFGLKAQKYDNANSA